MRVYEAFETSERLIDEGLPCEIEFGGQIIARVWVRPADANLNRAYGRAVAEKALALRGNGLDQLTDAEDASLIQEIYVEHVIVRWEWTDPADKKDAKLKFNKKNALALFTRVPKFFEAIQRGARNWDNYRKIHEEDAAGNS